MGATSWIIFMANLLPLPIIFIITGLLVKKFRRGYNTRQTALSPQARDFATGIIGPMMVWIGLLGLLLLLAGFGIGFAFLESETARYAILWIVLGLPILLVILAIIRTELLLRRYFDKNGKPYQ